MVEMNSSVNTFMTADEISECVDGITKETSRELWAVATECSMDKTAKPLGGDGSDGTTEEPIHSEDYANQPKQFWPKLTEAAQANINDAYARDELFV